jgi:hypothetical protein
MVVSLAVAGGLASAVPARADVASPSSAAGVAVSAAKTLSAALADTSVTPPSGDFTITYDTTGLGINESDMQAIINEVQGENGRISDTFKRTIEQYALDVPGENTLTWENFDATLSVTATSFSITIPHGDFQTTASWWASVLIGATSMFLGYVIRGICLGVNPALDVLCTPLGGATAAFLDGIMTQAVDGTLSDASAWAETLGKTFFAALGGYLWEKYAKAFFKGPFNTWLINTGQWMKLQAQTAWAWMGAAISGGLQNLGDFMGSIGQYFPNVVDALSGVLSTSQPCDVYGYDGTPCTAAYSMDRAMYSFYDGPLYQVQRASDNTTADIGLLATGGYVDASQQDSFCANTTCTITKIYDQSPEWNDLTVEGAGGAAGADRPADASQLPITVDGHEAYGLDIPGGVGYRDNSTRGIAVNGQPEGMYMVASGTHVNSGCCFDFGNAETSTHDTGASHMDAVNVTTFCGSYEAPCSGSGPWVEADMENGQYLGGNGSNPNDTSNSSDFVTAVLKNDGQSTFELEGGNAQSGGLSKYWDGNLPSGYSPMHQEGAVVLGTGGDNSNSDVGSFFEGVMTQGFPSDSADAAVQAGIVAANYAGNSNGNGGSSFANGVTPSAAGPAVVHAAGATGAAASGYSSVYTVNSANGHLQESYLPYMGDNWSTQDLSAKYGTPAVMPGTQPVALVHCGYTSVYTVDASNGDLQETYLSNIGNGWATQDLSAKYGTPPTEETPTALVHSAGATGSAAACGFTSVYTVDRNGDLQETYLPLIGDNWTTQDLSANYGTPKVQPGTSPVAIVHCGYSSVYTVDGGSHDLQETYLPAIGDPWNSQDLSANYGTPKTDTTPTAVVHSEGASGASAGCGYTSVYTVDQSNRHLQETYLPNAGFPGDAWHSQDLSANYGTPAVAPGTAPVALVHMNFTSVYTVDQGSDQLQETYLPSIGGRWNTQSLSSNYGTPTTDQTPIVLLHPDASGNLDWASVYTINELNNDLQETYLPNTGFPGDPWVTQDLSAKYGTPTVAVQQSSESSWSVDHAGYSSVYTVDNGSGHLQETYLPAMGDNWSTQDLSAKYGTPAVAGKSAPEALVHDGFTSVYTVDNGSGDLQETYLQAIGDNWITQDLSAKYGTPKVMANTSPSALFHDGYASVYTVDSNGDLQETYLPGAGFPGDAWVSQDLSANYGTPKVMAGTSPVAILHDGYDSVYTIDTNGDLQETYLPVMGGNWITQDLSAKYGTPQTGTTPAAVFHDGYTSVYTVDNGSDDLQETYLPAIADNWTTQDLSANYGVPTSKQGTDLGPVALYHTGYTSVYYLNGSNSDVEEAYLPAISGPWHSQDLSANYGTPAANQTPSPLVHYAANGGLTWTSLYTVDNGSDDLQESYLPAIGNNWTTQDLTSKYGTPPV